jgi:hypothetical protein
MAGSTPILPELCAKVKATFEILLELNFASKKDFFQAYSPPPGHRLSQR